VGDDENQLDGDEGAEQRKQGDAGKLYNCGQMKFLKILSDFFSNFSSFFGFFFIFRVFFVK
jgi:hypothetical protein